MSATMQEYVLSKSDGLGRCAEIYRLVWLLSHKNECKWFLLTMTNSALCMLHETDSGEGRLNNAIHLKDSTNGHRICITENEDGVLTVKYEYDNGSIVPSIESLHVCPIHHALTTSAVGLLANGFDKIFSALSFLTGCKPHEKVD